MHFARTALIEKFCRLPQLRAAHDRIVNQKQTAILNEFMDRDELHLSDQIPLALHGRHEGAGPRGRIFDEGTGEGNAGFIGIPDGMRCTGIRHTGYGVRMYVRRFLHIPTGQCGAAAIAHFLHADSLVRGGRISVIDPQEGTDFHVLTGLYQGTDAFGGDDGDLAGTQFPIFLISQIQERKTFKGGAEGIVFFADDDGSTSHLIPGGIETLRGEQQNCHGTVDQFLRILQSFNQIIPLIDDCRHQLGRVDISAAHFQEMRMSAAENLHQNLFHVVDTAHRDNGIGAMVGTDDQRLRLIIRNTADSQISGHFRHILVELGTEGGVLDVMNGTIEPFIFTVYRHTCPACA